MVFLSSTSSNHDKTFVGLTHTRVFQGQQLNSLGCLLAKEHQDFLEHVIQEKYIQYPTLDIIEEVHCLAKYTSPPISLL